MGCSPSKTVPEELETRRGTPFVEVVNIKEVSDISPSERRHVKKTWKKLSSNLTGHGAKIFLRIFSLHPHIKQLFPCRDVTGNELLQDPHFRDHSFRFVQAVGAAVDNIDDLDGTLAPLLIVLGRQHIHFTGFQKDYFNVFTEAILEIWRQELAEDFSPSVESAWSNVVTFMMSKLKEGYHLASMDKVVEKENY